MDETIMAGDPMLLNEQAALLRECRAALDELLRRKPMLGAMQYTCGAGGTTLGNLRASLYAYRPQGVFGAPNQPLDGAAATAGAAGSKGAA